MDKPTLMNTMKATIKVVSQLLEYERGSQEVERKRGFGFGVVMRVQY